MEAVERCFERPAPTPAPFPSAAQPTARSASHSVNFDLRVGSLFDYVAFAAGLRRYIADFVQPAWCRFVNFEVPVSGFAMFATLGHMFYRGWSTLTCWSPIWPCCGTRRSDLRSFAPLNPQFTVAH